MPNSNKPSHAYASMTEAMSLHHMHHTTAKGASKIHRYNKVHTMNAYRLVESHNSSDTSLLEVVTVVIWGKGFEPVVHSSNIGGTRKRQQLACTRQPCRLLCSCPCHVAKSVNKSLTATRSIVDRPNGTTSGKWMQTALFKAANGCNACNTN